MSDTDQIDRVSIVPRGFTNNEYTPPVQERVRQTYASHRGIVEVIWVWDGVTFRMDIAAPQAISLDIAIPLHAVTIYVNGEAVWGNNAYQTNMAGVAAVEEVSTALHLMCPVGGAYHILACAV